MANTPFIRAALQAAIVALAISGGSVPAFAHAKLLSVDPAPAVAEKTSGTELRLSFSEGIELSFSKVTILDAGQKEIAHGELALDPADGKIVVVTLPDRLPRRSLHHKVVRGFVGRPQGCREPGLRPGSE